MFMHLHFSDGIKDLTYKLKKKDAWKNICRLGLPPYLFYETRTSLEIVPPPAIEIAMRNAQTSEARESAADVRAHAICEPEYK